MNNSINQQKKVKKLNKNINLKIKNQNKIINYKLIFIINNKLKKTINYYQIKIKLKNNKLLFNSAKKNRKNKIN